MATGPGRSKRWRPTRDRGGRRSLPRWMRTHGGIPFEEALKDLSVFLEHDRLLSSRHWHVGAGATVTLADTVDLETAFFTFVAGAATRYGVGVNVGVTWRFLGPHFGPSPSRAPGTEPLAAKQRRFSGARFR